MKLPLGPVVEWVQWGYSHCIKSKFPEMKKLSQKATFRTILSFLFLCMVNVMAFAQDSTGGGTTTTTTKTDISVTTEDQWYAQPWVWVVGGAVLILLLVALLRGGGRDRSTRTDRVEVKKTIRTDTDVD